MAFKKEGKRFNKRAGGATKRERHDFEKRRFEPAEERSFKKPFADKRPFSEKKSFGKKEFTKGGFELYDAECEACGKQCEVPFKPTGTKPVYCRECFQKGNGIEEKGARSARYDSSSIPADDIKEINRKLDKIMRALKID